MPKPDFDSNLPLCGLIPPRTTVVDLDEYRGDLNRLVSQILAMPPAQIRTARFHAEATAAAKAQRDDLQSIIEDFLRLARPGNERSDASHGRDTAPP